MTITYESARLELDDVARELGLRVGRDALPTVLRELDRLAAIAYLADDFFRSAMPTGGH